MPRVNSKDNIESPVTTTDAGTPSLNKRQRRRQRYKSNLRQKKDLILLKNEFSDQLIHRLQKRVTYLNRKTIRKYREAKAVYKDSTINQAERHEIFKSKFTDAKFVARYAFRAYLVHQKYVNKDSLEVVQVTDQQVQEYMNKILFK